MHDDRQRALEVLDDVLRWHLPPARWDDVEPAVQAVAQAVEDGDAAALRRAVDELALHGPVRGFSADAPPRPSARERVRERVNKLIHTLGGTRPPTGPVTRDPARE
jgi:CATRA-associated small protein